MADWSRLTKRLAGSDSPRVELSFAEIERVIGAQLPASSKYPAFWSNSSSYAKAWKRAGYESTRRNVATGHMGFVRTRFGHRPQPILHPTASLAHAADGAPPARGDVLLVGCVKTKYEHATAAQFLYQSPLFERRRSYAAASARPWFILSAEHGLVAPTTLIEPYDVYLVDQPESYRRAWGEWVAAKLEREVGDLHGLIIEVHAGAAYVEAIEPPLGRRGARLINPLEGLRQGEQLAWYTSEAVTADPAPSHTGTTRLSLPQPPPPPTVHGHSQAAVVETLLAYGAAKEPERPGITTFTPLAEANSLVINNPFAFLLAVIFDQGIPAERAWRAPYDLMKRLGHLDPARMAAEPAGVHVAVGLPPVLHRYREKVPLWLVDAARIVVTEYGGDAARIWNDEPTARELHRRLDDFPGIGQKKAAMAVEILERDLGVAIRDLDGSDIAYDVHVRRVFLRSGLAEFDDLDHVVDVARRAHPERPGAIDAPAWLIGRQWCHAGHPDCDHCVLAEVCPRDISRADRVRGS